MAGPTNRIRELRVASGLTQDELAARVNPPTSGPQIQRLETSQRQLTVDWMMRLSEALNCHPADLMIVPPAPTMDVRIATERVSKQVLDSLAARGLCIYEVLSGSVAGIGIDRGDLVTIDQNLTEPNGGDVVVIEITPGGQLLLRVYAGGGLVTTNRPGRNEALRLVDLGSEARILGVQVAAGNGSG